jgi:hypothetical protein
VLLTSCLVTMFSTVTAAFTYGYAWLVFSICAQGLAIGMTCGTVSLLPPIIHFPR